MKGSEHRTVVIFYINKNALTSLLCWGKTNGRQRWEQETSVKAITGIQISNKGSLGQSNGNGVVRSKQILNQKLIRLSVVKLSQGGLQNFGLSSWEEGVSIYWFGEQYRQKSFVGKDQRSSILDMHSGTSIFCAKPIAYKLHKLGWFIQLL